MAMQSSDSKYIFLPSNVNNDLYPHNSQDSYNVKLTSHVQLSGRHKAGLASIVLPTRWCNVTDEGNSFDIRVHSVATVTDVAETYTPREIVIPQPAKEYGTWDVNNERILVQDYVKWFNDQIPAELRSKIRLKIKTTPLPDPPTMKRQIVWEIEPKPLKSLITLKSPTSFWVHMGIPKKYYQYIRHENWWYNSKLY